MKTPDTILQYYSKSLLWYFCGMYIIWILFC